MQTHVLLSAPLSALDPGMDEARDDGEVVLQPLRALLRVSSRTPGMQDFLNPSSDESMAARIYGKSTHGRGPDARTTLTESVLKTSSPHKPRATLLSPTLRVVSTEEADGFAPSDRLACTAVKNSTNFVMRNSQPVQAGQRIVLLTWRLHSDRGASKATMQVSRVGPGRVRISIRNIDGRSSDYYAPDIPGPLMDRLFFNQTHDQIVQSPHGVAASDRVAAIPPRGSLPFVLQLQIAGFAQGRLRAHVLAAAAGPEFTNRPLIFDRFLVSWKNGPSPAPGPGPSRTPASDGMRIRAFLHPSSTTCFCKAHLARCPEECARRGERFTGRVTASMTIDMCGACMEPERGCLVHCGGGSNSCRQNTKYAPGVCCTNLVIAFSCAHEIHESSAQASERGPGTGSAPGAAGSRARPKGFYHQVRVRTQMDSYDWDELSMLVAAAAEYDRAASWLHWLAASTNAEEAAEGKRGLVALVQETTERIEQRIAAFDVDALSSSRRSDEDMARMDIAAMDLLRDGGVAQETPRNGVRRLVRPRGQPLTTDERKLARTHGWLFPGVGALVEQCRTAAAPCPVPAAAVPASVEAPLPDSDPEGGVDSLDAQNDPMASAQHLAKKQRLEQKGFDYVSMVEYMDPSGLAHAQGQLAALLANGADLTTEQRERAVYFQQQLEQYNEWYGPEEDGPLGLPARPLRVTYRMRNDGGRLYPTGMPMAPGFKSGQERALGIQGAPRELRPFLCCRWGHDYDMANAQPQILRQMPTMLTWADGRGPPCMPELDQWCLNRPEYIGHVAEVHSLPTDEDMYHEYRKDSAKDLMVRMMFGGHYKSWVKEVCKSLKRDHAFEPASPRVNILARELKALRGAVFASDQWKEFVARDRERLRREGIKQSDDEIDRSVFASVAQKTENDVLTVMRAYLNENGWTALALCFDGLIVQHRPERVLDLAAMCARIKRDTGYELSVVEKPLYSQEFPSLSLDRFKK
jgi:hypothetical protein